MPITLTAEEQKTLKEQVETCRQVRQWKRAQAVLLLAQGLLPEQVAMVLSCSRASVYNWAAAWKRQGSVVLCEESHAGRPPELDPKALELLDHWLEEGNPQQQG
jgi:transposase